MWVRFRHSRIVRRRVNHRCLDDSSPGEAAFPDEILFYLADSERTDCPPCVGSAGDVVHFVGTFDGIALFTLDWGCRPTLVSTTRRSHPILIHHDRRFTLDEGCLPCVRHSFLTCSLREMIDYRVQVTLWTKGVASRKFSTYQMKGYSLLTRGVANPLESGVFTLD